MRKPEHEREKDARDYSDIIEGCSAKIGKEVRAKIKPEFIDAKPAETKLEPPCPYVHAPKWSLTAP